MSYAAQKAKRRLGEIASDCRGVVAIEFAIFAGLLCFAILNVVDVSVYVYQRMQVENATEMGAQAAWKACDLLSLPATKNCPTLTTSVQNAVHSTSLGTRVALKSGSPSEGYYCVNSSQTLQYVSDITSRPADCSAVGMSNLQPADYVRIDTTFSYTPLIPGLTVANTFATPITRSAWMRLD